MRLKEPPSLRQTSLDVFFNYLSSVSSEIRSRTELEKVRTYCIEWIPSDIRQELLDIFRVRMRNLSNQYLDLLQLLGDKSIRKVCVPNAINGDVPQSSNYLKLMIILTKYDITKLRQLIIRVCVNNSNEQDKLKITIASEMMNTYLSGRGGEYLRVLDIQGSCKNEFLVAIGKNCKHLVQLNIANSWVVNDSGIKNLCIKNAGMFNISSEGGERNKEIFDKIMNVPEGEMNDCCFTIQKITIQGTNTSHISMMMLLKFMINLKTFGGYIYNRSIGDTIISYRNKYPLARELTMSQLWDAHLPTDKMCKLRQHVPHLDTLYTWMKFLIPPFRHFDNLTIIILDFDHKPYEYQFERYLSENGKTIESITITDQMSYIDLIEIAKSCPKLMNLVASVDIKVKNDVSRTRYYGFDYDNITMKCLKMAHVYTYTANCLLWIFTNCPVLKCLELIMYTKVSSGAQFVTVNDSYLRLLISSHSVAFKSLEYVIISYGQTSYIEHLSVQSLISFLENFEKLRIFGNLTTLLTHNDQFDQLANYMKENNRDIHLFRGSEFQPPLPDDLLELVHNPEYGGRVPIIKILFTPLYPV